MGHRDRDFGLTAGIRAVQIREAKISAGRNSARRRCYGILNHRHGAAVQQQKRIREHEETSGTSLLMVKRLLTAVPILIPRH